MRGVVGEARLGDLVEAVCGGGHVLVHAVQAGVQRGAVRVPQLQAAGPRALAVFTIRRLRVTGQCG